MTKIKCPKCKYKPKPHDMWVCKKCKHVWNTFETYGQCPVCGFVHKYTKCITCRQWSLHIDWYSDLDSELRKELNKLFEKVPVDK